MSTSITKQGIIFADGESIGENILTGTGINSYKSGDAAHVNTNAASTWAGASGGNGVFTVVEDFSVPVGMYSWNITDNTSGNRDYQQGQQPFIANTTYTASWWAKGDGISMLRVWNATDGKAMFTYKVHLTETWDYYTYTFTATEEYESDSCSFLLGCTGIANISICGMKLEKGSTPTPWTPNPNDAIYTGEHGFFEGNDIASIGKGYVSGREFYEM